MYEIGHYRQKQFSDGKVLLTNDYGKYIILNKEDFNNFQKHEIKKELLQELTEKGFILQKENDNLVDMYRQKNSNLFRSTSLHIIVPTLRCNLGCVYCHAKSKATDTQGYDMDKKTADKVVDFIFQTPSNSFDIEFQGGEPLLNFDTIKYITHLAKEKNTSDKIVKVSVVTNLSLMDEEKLDFIIKNKINICTSLDGPEFIHDKNRPFSGASSHKLVTGWIQKIKKDYNYHVDALMVTTKSSLPYPKEIIDEYIKYGFSKIQIKPLTRLNKAKSNWDEIGYSPVEFLDFFKKSMDYIIELNMNGVKMVESLSYYILSKVLTDKASFFLDLQSPCGAAIGQLAYDYDGSIYTCDEGRCFDIFKLGNVFENTHKQVLSSDKTCSMIAFSINDNFICDNCAYKNYCGLCPVVNYSQTGNLVTNVAQSDRCKIFKGIFDYLFEQLKNPEVKKIFQNWVKE